jgi:hypothetical protein
MRDHLAMARKGDDAGIAAVWLRNVPFFDPSFGDVGKVFDPMVYAGFLAGFLEILYRHGQHHHGAGGSGASAPSLPTLSGAATTA